MGILVGLLFVAFVVSAIIALAILRAFTLVLLWEWFVIPTFGLPALSIVAAIGLTLFVATFENNIDTEGKKEEDKESWKEKGSKLLWAFLNYPVIIVIGWIVKQFM